MNRLISRLTMKRVGSAFYDCVSRRNVFLYLDKYGVRWLANRPFFPWSHRVKDNLQKGGINV